MRRYTLVSGIFLTLLTGVQRVAGFDVPLWVSGIAAVIVGSLAVWAFRARAHRDSAAAV